ncbi:MAG: FMN-binding negative transcriptional regulator [Flavobacteriaceae bacterium]
MYIPHIYKNENLEEIRDFVSQNAFAILVSQVDGNPWASHIPLELKHSKEGGDRLVGHLAKANPQWRSFSDKQKVLAIFNGPHSYVSSSWYKKEEVPTWNYIAVHIYGTINLQDETQLHESLNTLVDKYEQESQHPVSLHDLSDKTMRQIGGIVGFEISIDEIHAAYKLSQGRAHDHQAIISELEQKKNPGSQAIAEEMKKRKTN